ncbi:MULTISPECIES: 3-hydroxyacyl-CoA dehydrogenase NAD-binding domain-containing protein [Acidiphilium]|uniref:Short chain enoyl-CoA hydratase /3-hydroxyacyl-CoA dehydrogenase n=1 Tax=Acidiphilium rubrum TaxID=526 RepID=A0A8G2FGK6_ACIRU|nr:MULTISPECIES: 3-hydroxyacyl-CoA dehydrogenase NAD-binding domain-containing protein [Acidiphilium]SIQ79409.1 short chain enoyl-CoA hydratase /3-hydroxyacyl-CoA dehydrogenase [Acidiphilium rubrum]
MSQPVVDLDMTNGIAVIAIDSPPVNALGHAVRSALLDALTRAEADPATKIIILACKGRTFSAGADITEFGKPPRDPGLHEVIERFDQCSKPTIAALFGTTLGGGLELAMGCHYRVATDTARMGLPEVKLGLLPGAGGTQRLPRLIGPEKAVAAIVSGKMISAKSALADGLIDAIVTDPVQGAIDFAHTIDPKVTVRVRDRADKIAPAQADPAGFEQAAAEATRRLRGVEAPAACVNSVRNAFTLPFEQGLAAERDMFMHLVMGDQSRAQRHIFFAEREAQKIPGMEPGLKPAPVKSAAVIGAGTMGGGIAMNFANAGIPVTLVETDEAALQRGLDRVRDTYDISVKRGALPAGATAQRMALFAGTTDWSRIAEADMVIEAVFEEMDLKKQIFGRLDAVAKSGAVIATNTSTLDVDAIAHSTKRPSDVLGMHFFSPANVMKLLEIVRGEASSHQSIATAIAVGKAMGKVPVVVGNCDGFVGNRMLARRTTECERLLLEGALPQQVDAVVLNFGFPMGPFAMGDLAGLDVGWRIRKHRGVTAPISDVLCEQGRFGQKTGRGYYIYENGSRTPTPDPEVAALIEATAARLGITRRAISDQEILERMTYPMINEAARILEEGIAIRPSDIDVVWVYGYGWPVWRGGPCFHADLVGLPTIVERLAHYANTTGDVGLQPSDLLTQLAAEGKGFADFGKGAKAAAA